MRYLSSSVIRTLSLCGAHSSGMGIPLWVAAKRPPRGRLCDILLDAGHGPGARDPKPGSAQAGWLSGICFSLVLGTGFEDTAQAGLDLEILLPLPFRITGVHPRTLVKCDSGGEWDSWL